MSALEVLERAKRDVERLRPWRLRYERGAFVVERWRAELDGWRAVLRCQDVKLAEDYLLRKVPAPEGGGGLDCRFRIT